MDNPFWLERWQAHQLGWHREDVNPLLREYWTRLGACSGTKVFVPLCGKTLDMGFLADQGHEVLGCELSGIAVEEFFAEAGLARETREPSTEEQPFVHHRSGAVTILEGDVFNLDRALLAGVGSVYDRGALIALPREKRRRYVELLTDALPEAARTLLMTLEYDQTRIGGPPFSVDEEEVHALYGAAYRVELLYSEETEEIPPRFSEVGLGGPSSPVRQKVWRIMR